LEDYLRELAAKYKVSDRVYFHGFIPDDEVNYLFNMADLFVMPSRKVDNSVEGFGITYLEAASAETPSIGSLGTGAEDAIEDGKSGLLVDGESTESIRNGIRYFTKNPEALGTMGKYAAQRGQQFTWGNVANEFINTFEKYLS
jgi:phosphatidylinositol alpha-1,6-mannosyltransferase